MKTRGKLTDVTVPFRSRKPVISFEVTADPEDIEKYADMDLDITFVKHRQCRSLDANAMLWACLGEMAKALRTDNWSMYLYELERYGKYTHILVIPEAVESVKAQWRETKVVGEMQVIDPGTGKPRTMIQMLCFYGSSTYNTAEFSRLLDGVVSDMKDMHLETPPDAEMRELLRQMERRESDTRGRQAQAGQGRQK